MKKILIIVLGITLISIGVYVFFNKSTEYVPKCADGFRFVPSTQTCESTQVQKKESIDFSKAVILIPDTQTKIQLQQEGESTRYSGKSQNPENASSVQFISLDSKDIVEYSPDLVLVPFMYETGGTGQFVYLGLFETTTHTLLSSRYIGDRIDVSSIAVVNEKIKVNFKTRLDSESFAVQPSIPAQSVFGVLDNKLVDIMVLQNSDYGDVELKSPITGTPIENTLFVKGSIPGSWYFEAIAQFKIVDIQNNEIAIGTVQALSDWMTTQRVPFEFSTSTASLNYKGKAILIIQSGNIQGGGEEGEKMVKKMYVPIEIK